MLPLSGWERYITRRLFENAGACTFVKKLKRARAFSQQRVRKAESMGADGVVILLADQPQLSVNHLNALVAMASESFAVSSSLGAFARQSISHRLVFLM